MADETPEDRLEAALERIAKIVDGGSVAPMVAAGPLLPVVESLSDQAAAEFFDRLDRIIGTLREALGK